MQILTVKDIQKLIQKIGLAALFKDTVAALKEDFGRWHGFSLSSRIARDEVRFFDIDAKAMSKFSRNLSGHVIFL